MDKAIEKKMIYQLAYVRFEIDYEADSDGNAAVPIVNDTSLCDTADKIGKLLNKISMISSDYLEIVKEETAKARKAIYGE